MSLVALLAMNLGVSLTIMFALWVISVLVKDASIVDPYWGMGFVVLAWFSLFVTGSWNGYAILLVTLVTLWGTRLTTFLLIRNIGKGEDRRYVAMRHKHGDSFWWVSLLTVFLLQGCIMWFVAFPILVGVFLSPSFVWATLTFGIVTLGTLIWMIGFFFEAVGDYQMAKFKSDENNKGKVMDRGLWRLTRHPNYFGDFCIWWGQYVIAAAAGAWWTLLSPITMSFFLLKVSGVTLLESDIEDRRPDYREYKRVTNAFFPGPRKQLER